MTEGSQFLRKAKMRNKSNSKSHPEVRCVLDCIYTTLWIQYLNIDIVWSCSHLYIWLHIHIYIYNYLFILHGYRFCMFAFDAPTLDCRNCWRKRAVAICTGDCHQTFLIEFSAILLATWNERNTRHLLIFYVLQSPAQIYSTEPSWKRQHFYGRQVLLHQETSGCGWLPRPMPSHG